MRGHARPRANPALSPLRIARGSIKAVAQQRIIPICPRPSATTTSRFVMRVGSLLSVVFLLMLLSAQTEACFQLLDAFLGGKFPAPQCFMRKKTILAGNGLKAFVGAFSIGVPNLSPFSLLYYAAQALGLVPKGQGPPGSQGGQGGGCGCAPPAPPCGCGRKKREVRVNKFSCFTQLSFRSRMHCPRKGT